MSEETKTAEQPRVCTHGAHCMCATVSDEKYEAIAGQANKFLTGIYTLMQVMQVNPNAALNALCRMLALVIDTDDVPFRQKLETAEIAKQAIVGHMQDRELHRKTAGTVGSA